MNLQQPLYKQYQSKQTEHKNYSVYNSIQYPMSQFSVVSEIMNHGAANTKIGTFMSRITQVPEPSNTCSNQQLVNQQSNRNQNEKRFRSQSNNNKKMLGNSTMKQKVGITTPNFDSAYQSNLTKIGIELNDLKEKTIYKANTTNHSYSIEQLYFGLFNAKNKSTKLHSSFVNSIKNLINERNENTNDNIMKNRNKNEKDINTIISKLSQRKRTQSKQKFNDMNQQYDRLRKCLEQLESENQKLKKNNQILLKNNQDLQKHIEKIIRKSKNNHVNIIPYNQINQISSNNDYSPLLINQEKLKKIIKNVKNSKSQSSIIQRQSENQSSRSQEENTCHLLIQAQQEILIRDSIIKDLQMRLQELTQDQKNNDKINQLAKRVESFYQKTIGQTDMTEIILQLKNIVTITNNQIQIIHAKFERLYKKMDNIISSMNSIKILCQKQQTQILKKQMEIDLEIKHTQSVLADFKREQQTAELSNTYHKNKSIFPKKENLKNDGNILQVETNEMNKFSIQCKNNHFENKIKISPLMSIQTSFHTLEQIPLTNIHSQDLGETKGKSKDGVYIFSNGYHNKKK